MRPFIASAAAVLFSTGIAQAQATPDEICLFQEENWTEVIEACTDAIAAIDDPVEQGRYVLHRAIAHEAQGDLDAAIEDQVRVGDYRPDWFRGYSNAASLAFTLGDTEAHLQWAQAAIDAEPENPRAYGEMLFALVDGDDPALCEDLAGQVMDLLPHPVDWPFMAARDEHLMGNLGYCMQTLGRDSLALQAYRAAEAQGLDTAWLYSNMSYLAYFRLERADLGAEYATRAVELGGRSLYDADTLVYSLVDLGDLDGALEVVRSYADLLDEQEEEWGTRNVVGWALFLDGRLEEASEVMEAWAVWAENEIAEGRVTQGHIWDTVAHIRAGLNDTEGASAAFRRVIEEYEESERAYEFYGSQLTAMGFDIGEGEAGLLEALDACAATGPACRFEEENPEPTE
ncbi:hypothetical protein HKCCE4037_08185 [Rhodobacterales bacterium HKCCE4037]|nr:hypothetical protein [Rhodobacterales bacterium HKCCE4037]